ncbi:hypothetical protein H8356DRAFT_1345990 [Neocallimastix lanati (nom. inval.)]|nr:hypothetical protein H8356DRAFT_1345990 [Neocallimastix sp. JGI-2020a]
MLLLSKLLILHLIVEQKFINKNLIKFTESKGINFIHSTPGKILSKMVVLLFYNNHKSNKFENNSKPGIILGYVSDSLGHKILDYYNNSIITARDVYFFLEEMPGTINTTFFCNKYIDPIIDFIITEGKVNNKIITYMNSNNNNNNNNNNNYNNNNNNNNNNNYNNNNSNNNNDTNNNSFNNNQNINTNLNKSSLIDNNNLNNNNLNNNDNNKNSLNNKRSLEEENFTSDEKTRRSTSGFIFLLGDSPISWKSQQEKKQVEFVSLTECAKQYNKACIAIAQDTNSKGRLLQNIISINHQSKLWEEEEEEEEEEK